MNKAPKLKKVRYESFGGIVEMENPPLLAFVDKDFMKDIGYQNSVLWNNTIDHLSAPTEVHFAITNKCPLRCNYCAASAGKTMLGELSTNKLKRAIDILAKMNVFHVALGGGELFERQDAIEIAEYCRSRGIVPNATINGYHMSSKLAEKCRVFGQLNVSMDGIGSKYNINRGGENIFYRVDQAIKNLVNAGVAVGINTVVTRRNFDTLEEIVAYAQELNLKEILFLRLKPAGRGRDIYFEYRPTHEQNKRLFPLLMKWANKYDPLLQVDCSLTPHICYHNPSKNIMNFFGIEGCTGGNILLGIRPDGYINACSHYPKYYKGVFNLPEMWQKNEHFKIFRNRKRKINDADCLNCPYFSVCYGGCPLFSEFLKGDFNLPDPECPILVERKGGIR